MKRLLVAIICFFSFTVIVSASSMSSAQIDIYLHKDSTAEVVENWTLSNGSLFERILDSQYSLSEITVSNNSRDYRLINKCELVEDYTYCIKDNTIKIKTKSRKETIKITYNMSKFVVQYKDITGLFYDVLPVKSDISIDKLELSIRSEVKLQKDNTISYAVGKNVSVNIEGDSIKLIGDKIESHQKMILLTNFDNTLIFDEYTTIDKTFEDIYQEAIKKESIFDRVIKLIRKEMHIAIIAIVLILLIVLFVNRVLLDRKGRDTYRHVVLYEDKVLPRMSAVPYYESIPCNGSLLKINYLGGYFGIIKNKSNIIGAYIFKWVCEGRCVIVNDKLRMNSKTRITNRYERILYALIYKAARDNILDSKRLKNYIDEHCDEFIEWFKEVDKTVIDAELSKETIRKSKRNLVIQEPLYHEAENILGLKRYLLHFNQVPRQVPLNENSYKSLLVCAVLFGVEEDVSKEILRKNKDNIFAAKLLEFSKMSDIYKGTYQQIRNRIVLTKVTKKEDDVSEE